MELPEGRGGPFCEPILENPEEMGGHRKNPFRWGGGVGGVGMDIFWNYTIPITVPRVMNKPEMKGASVMAI